MSKATAINLSGTDFVRCQLYDNTNHLALDGSTYQVGNAIVEGGSITNLATIVEGGAEPTVGAARQEGTRTVQLQRNPAQVR